MRASRLIASKHASGWTVRQYENTQTIGAPMRLAIENARSVRRGWSANVFFRGEDVLLEAQFGGLGATRPSGDEHFMGK